MIASQLGIVASLLAMAMVNPAIKQASLIAAFAPHEVARARRSGSRWMPARPAT